MRRLLFVDEEPRVLAGLRTLLRRYRHEWDMVFVDSAGAAMAVLEGEGRTEVLVTDLGVGGHRRGPDLLERVKTEHPEVVRIILSGSPELQASMQAMEKAHRFLTKPCDPDVLRFAVERACRLRDMLDTPRLREVAGTLGSLPSIPSIYAELVEALSDPDVGVREVAAIVERDAGMCAQIFHIVNSAYFGTVRRISSIHQAVTFLGTRMLKNLVLSVEVFKAFETERRIPGFDLERLQDHTSLTARIASQLVERPRSDDAFMAAMLHDVGFLMLAARLPDELAHSLAEASRRGCSVAEVEREVTGTTHAELGAYLLGLWGLPGEVVDAVAHHHTPGAVESPDLDLVAAVHIADALAHAVRPKHVDARAEVDAAWLEAHGWADRWEEWLETATRIAAGEGGAR